jgi:hypothetical protein
MLGWRSAYSKTLPEVRYECVEKSSKETAFEVFGGKGIRYR